MEQNPSFPSPEELKAKLSEFMKSNFGDQVSFATFTEPEAAEAGERRRSRAQIDDDEFVFNFLPRDIKAHLDRFVIKQDEAKKVLSIAVCDHYNHVIPAPAREGRCERAPRNRIREAERHPGRADRRRENLPDQHIADLIKVPFVKADATKFSETGYVGGDVEDLVRELVRQSRWRRQPRAVRHHLHRRDRQDRRGRQHDRARCERPRRADDSAEADGGNGSAAAQRRTICRRNSRRRSNFSGAAAKRSARRSTRSTFFSSSAAHSSG